MQVQKHYKKQTNIYMGYPLIRFGEDHFSNRRETELDSADGQTQGYYSNSLVKCL